MKWIIAIAIGLLLGMALRAEDTQVTKPEFIALAPADQIVFDRLLQANTQIQNELEKLRLKGCIGKVKSADECGAFDQQGRIAIVKPKEEPKKQ